jgi:hypothetical protein
MRSFVTCYKGDQVSEDERDGACSTNGTDEKYTNNFCRETSRNETTQKTQKAYWKESWAVRWEGVDWMYLAQLGTSG